MTSKLDRQRAAARARLEREMSERAQEATVKRRLRLRVVGAVSAVALLAVVVLIVIFAGGGDDKKTPQAAAATTATCDYKSVRDGSTAPEAIPTTLKDVGKPDPVQPRKGVQLMTMNTGLGPITIELATAKAPCLAGSFTYLAGKKFFDNSKCHRMTTSGIYVLQCGDPSATGTGGPQYRISDENLPTNHRPTYPEGVVAMANAGENTNGSQFFIVFKDTPDLQANYSVIGKVRQGLDIIKKVAAAGVTPTSAESADDGAPKMEVAIKTLTVDPPVDSLPKLPPTSPAAETSAASSAAASAPASVPASAGASPSK